MQSVTRVYCDKTAETSITLVSLKKISSETHGLVLVLNIIFDDKTSGIL